jgi:GcrA cell cycle regulator
MSWRAFHESVSAREARQRRWLGGGAGFGLRADSIGGLRGAAPIRRGQEDEAKMSWTDEQVEILRQLWLDGKSASQISAQLGHGLSRNAVIGKVHRLGLAGRAKSSSSAAAPPRPAPAPRLATRANSGGGARAAVRGTTALAIAAETMLETRPVFRDEDVVVPMSLRVTIIELKEAMCRWPLGDPTSSEFRYCGSPTLGVSPYCAHHSRLAYQPAQDRRRERDRERRSLDR